MAGLLGIGTTTELIASYVITPAGGVLLGGWKRDLEYAGKHNTPNIIPSPDAALHAYYHGDLSLDRLFKIFRSHGMYVGPEFIKNPDKIIRGRWYDKVGRDWSEILASHQPHVSIIEALQLANRDKKYLDNLDRVLVLEGFKDPEKQEMVKEFLKAIPTPSELVHFTLRHGFEPDVIIQYEEFAEFPQTSRDWFAKLGLDYPISITSPIDKKTYTKIPGQDYISWADLYWWTHWVPISPTQAFSIMQRVREDNRDEWEDIAPNARPYTIEDVRRWLRVNDYPPGVRDNLTALSFNPLGRIDIRRMYNVGVLPFEKLHGQYRNLGYSPINATRLANFTAKQKIIAETKPVEEQTRAKVISLFKSGVIPENTAVTQLYRLTFLDPDRRDEYDRLNADDQLFVASRSTDVKMVITFAKLEITEDKVKHYLKFYHQRFMHGDISNAELEISLLAIGVQKWRIDDIIEEWSIELSGIIKHTSVSENVKWAKEGVITLAMLDTRLTNLHVPVTDRILWTQEVVNKLSNDALKASKELIAAQKKAVLQQTKQKLAQQKAADAAMAKIQKQRQIAADKAAVDERRRLTELDRLATVANIKVWYKQGFINDAWVEERMKTLGVAQGDIDLFIRQLQEIKAGQIK